MDQQQFIQQVTALVVAELRGGEPGACNIDLSGNPNMACANVLWSPVSTEKFYRSCRTQIDVVETGVVPIAPGASTTFSQANHPGWLGGCFQITYQLANNATNHGDIKIEWFLDDELLDTAMWGSEIYDNANHMIGDGYHPLPMHCGKQCCIGGLNKLKVKITHTGGANQLQTPRIFVTHGKRACCNACAVGRSCQQGCGNGMVQHAHQPAQMQGVQGGVQVLNLQLPQGVKLVP